MQLIQTTTAVHAGQVVAKLKAVLQRFQNPFQLRSKMAKILMSLLPEGIRLIKI